MRRFAILFISIVFTFTAAACSSGDKNMNKTDKTASELLNTVLDSIDFPPTVEITEKSAFEEMGIDLSVTEDHAAVKQMLSVDVVEVIILMVKDGETEITLEQLNARKDSLINDFAYYPEQVESANATIVGSEGNVAYLICHVDSEKAEKKLIEKINF